MQQLPTLLVKKTTLCIHIIDVESTQIMNYDLHPFRLGIQKNAGQLNAGDLSVSCEISQTWRW